MASKVIHITDFHLYGDSELAAWGAWGDVRPYSALEAVLVLAKSKVRLQNSKRELPPAACDSTLQPCGARKKFLASSLSPEE